MGLDPLDPSAVWRAMYDGTAWYGRRGVAIHAMASVDVALWDVRAQALGVPHYQALAAWTREPPAQRAPNAPSERTTPTGQVDRAEGTTKVRAYASVLWPDRPSGVEPLAGGLVELGFTAVKLGWGPFGEDSGTDRALLRAARRVVGDGALMVDVGRRWRVPDAVEGRRVAADYGVEWVEEPLHPDDLAGYAKLVDAVNVVIAAGETEEMLGDCAAFLDAGVQIL